MKLLEIKTTEGNFIKFILYQYISRLLFNYNKSDFYTINRFLDNFDIDVEDILEEVIKKLTYVRYNELFYIVIPENCKLKNFNLIDLCKLIEYGTIDIPPYPIFYKTSMFIKNNLQSYKYQYDLMH